MRRWEFVLQDRYEQDRNRLLDYREVELEFREWLINLLYEGVKTYEPGKHNTDDGPVHDDRICDREQLGPVQSEVAYPGPDPKDDGRTEVSTGDFYEEERLAELIAAEPVTDFEAEVEEEHDIYESFYEEIDTYKCQQKARPKKKHYKRKGAR